MGCTSRTSILKEFRGKGPDNPGYAVAKSNPSSFVNAHHNAEAPAFRNQLSQQVGFGFP